MEFKTKAQKIGGSTFIKVPQTIKDKLELQESSDILEVSIKKIRTYHCVACTHEFSSEETAEDEVECVACGSQSLVLVEESHGN